jgi:hypothetical protein
MQCSVSWLSAYYMTLYTRRLYSSWIFLFSARSHLRHICLATIGTPPASALDQSVSSLGNMWEPERKIIAKIVVMLLSWQVEFESLCYLSSSTVCHCWSNKIDGIAQNLWTLVAWHVQKMVKQLVIHLEVFFFSLSSHPAYFSSLVAILQFVLSKITALKFWPQTQRGRCWICGAVP